MIVLLGESGSGKTAVRDYLTSRHGYYRVVSCTTRKPRANELYGRDYYFLSSQGFSDKIKNDEFVEYSMYKNNYYGVPKTEIDDNGVAILEPFGLKNLLNNLSEQNIVSFYITASEEVRQQRMLHRGDGLLQSVGKITADRKHFADKVFQLTDFTLNSEKYSISDLGNIVDQLYTYTLQQKI